MRSSLPDATTQERNASNAARHGNRYYPVDESYDKRVYENTWGNIAIIVVVLFIFWIVNALHWWGIFSLGIVDADALIWYSLGSFVFTILFLAGILTSGKYANAIKRKHEFYKEKIAEKVGLDKEADTKRKQEAAHEQKLAEQQKKIDAIKKEMKAKAAADAAAVDQPTATAPGFVQQIVTHIQDAPADNRLIRGDARQ